MAEPSGGYDPASERENMRPAPSRHDPEGLAAQLIREEALRLGAKETPEGFEFERPYAVINGTRIPLPMEDIDVDEDGRPLAGNVTIRVALGIPRVHVLPRPTTVN